MAPGANITLYIGNWALPVFFPIAFIDQQHAVQTVSQSWSIYEWYYSVLGPAFYTANLQLADYYYALGSLEGITFIASTGDAGGSGYNAGLLGTTGYPQHPHSSRLLEVLQFTYQAIQHYRQRGPITDSYLTL